MRDEAKIAERDERLFAEVIRKEEIQNSDSRVVLHEIISRRVIVQTVI